MTKSITTVADLAALSDDDTIAFEVTETLITVRTVTLSVRSARQLITESMLPDGALLTDGVRLDELDELGSALESAFMGDDGGDDNAAMAVTGATVR